MIEINKDGYITGWNSPTKEQMKELAQITIENMFDNHRNPQWKYAETDEGISVTFVPQTLTTSQKEKDRKDNIQKEVTYSVTDELALINKAIINGVTDTEYVAYRAAIEALKTKYPKES